MSRLSMRVSAPAVVVLATVVNAAAAMEAPLASAAPPAPDLSWALKGGVTEASRGTRAYLAQKAATRIHSLDWLAGATCEPFGWRADVLPACGLEACAAELHQPFAEQSTHSTHQHSAP
jgi:hypothetical protein